MTSEERKALQTDADSFLNTQLDKLTREQKETLSYVLLGATISDTLLGKKGTQE